MAHWNPHYALTDWVECDLVALHDVASGFNAADAIAKQTRGILFAHHHDTITGCRAPAYVLLSSVPLGSSMVYLCTTWSLVPGTRVPGTVIYLCSDALMDHRPQHLVPVKNCHDPSIIFLNCRDPLNAE